jgi:hypothetical protein
MTKLTETTKVRPSDLLAAAAAIAAGTQAYAEPIIFINPDPGEPGHFNWAWLGSSDELWLDLTRPSTQQGAGVGPTSVGQLGVSNYYYAVNATSGAAMVATVRHAIWTMYFTDSFSAGESIDGQLDFMVESDHARYQSFLKLGFVSYIPPAVPTYMGVRFTDVDGYHYGWIGVVRDSFDLDAFAWGYETEPGVGIVAGIPAPGTLAALAFGAVVRRRGRMRKND